MQTVKTFIDQLDGTVKVATELGVPVSTVSGWNLSNSIPHWRIPALEALAAEKGVGFPDDLRPEKAA